jgi:hypothetical protein
MLVQVDLGLLTVLLEDAAFVVDVVKKDPRGGGSVEYDNIVATGRDGRCGYVMRVGLLFEL